MLSEFEKTNFYEMGWVCPKCGAVMSPREKACINCTGKSEITIGAGTTGTPITPTRGSYTTGVVDLQYSAIPNVNFEQNQKHKRGRPRKAKAEEPKPKRPVGRPKNIKNQKIEKGDLVKILKSKDSHIADINNMIGKVCEVYSIIYKYGAKKNEPLEDKVRYAVYQEDKNDWWEFGADEVELVKKGDKK